jgi:hypothetical protein
MVTFIWACFALGMLSLFAIIPTYRSKYENTWRFWVPFTMFGVFMVLTIGAMAFVAVDSG